MSEIKRFDETEFEILIQASPDGMGYFTGEKYTKRALLMMGDGILKASPIEKWASSGWDLTESGKSYYKEFLRKVRDTHGHEWKTSRESYPEDYKDDNEFLGDGDAINRFAYSVGTHNGFMCKRCGYVLCIHCRTEFGIPKCTGGEK